MYQKKLVLLLGVFLIVHTAFSQTQFTVVIDPGHGGVDPGTLRSSAARKHEKDINLAISFKLGNYIKEKLPNVQVIYTRTTDRFISLDERAELANEKKADVFISIHANSSPKSTVHGTETHIYSHKQIASKKLASLIEKEFKTRAARKSRGIIDANRRGQNLFVTQYTQMPCVLVETGYLTNPTEEKYLNSESGQALIASAIFRALRSFIQTGIPQEDRSYAYRVQIMASTKKINLKSKVFERLNERVVEVKNENAAKYKYKYLIGREYDHRRATLLAKKVAELGFKDAFVIKFK